jgi:hypothetical protein
MLTKEDKFWNFFVYLGVASLAFVFLVKWVPVLQGAQGFVLPAFVLSVVSMTITTWQTPRNIWYSMSGLILMSIGLVFMYIVGDVVIGGGLFIPGLLFWLYAALRYVREK